ncbi:MAG: CHAP domain-containing protein [Candidatus Eremiobacteraeota bacterium]|nr:CHAP domain-containing protein [Candidatus Eremiobacteraeota bacterium]
MRSNPQSPVDSQQNFQSMLWDSVSQAKQNLMGPGAQDGSGLLRGAPDSGVAAAYAGGTGAMASGAGAAAYADGTGAAAYAGGAPPNGGAAQTNPQQMMMQMMTQMTQMVMQMMQTMMTMMQQMMKNNGGNNGGNNNNNNGGNNGINNNNNNGGNNGGNNNGKVNAGVDGLLQHANQMVGLDENRDTAAIKKITGESGINPATTPWCAAWAMNMLKDHGVLDTKGLSNPNYCPTVKSWGKEKGIWKEGGSAPKAGDAILFDWDGDNTPDHIGIVEKVEGGKVYTIEGNSSDKVSKRSYALNSGSIDGYLNT